MSKVIVSYDGTANEDDAIALGRILGNAGAEVSLAYVRHTPEADSEQAQEVLAKGAEILGNPAAGRHVVTDPSTPRGLSALAAAEGADVVVFCSDSHTAKGHVAIGNSAERLLEGGNAAVAIAPVDLAEVPGGAKISRIVSVGDADGGADDTANALAAALGASVEPVANDQTDLLVIDSRPDVEPGRVSISSSASHLIENSTCAVLVLPRGSRLQFGRNAAGAAA